MHRTVHDFSVATKVSNAPSEISRRGLETYSLWGCNDTPIDEWLVVRDIGRLVAAVERRNLGIVAIIELVEATGFNDCYRCRRVLTQAQRECQAGSASSYDLKHDQSSLLYLKVAVQSTSAFLQRYAPELRF